MEIKNISTILSTCTQITRFSRKKKLRKIIISFVKVERKQSDQVVN
jgi:hypothetical protein